MAVAVTITLNGGGKCKDARVVLGNAAATTVRAKEAEKVLIGAKLTDAVFEKAGEAAAEECSAGGGHPRIRGIPAPSYKDPHQEDGESSLRKG